MTRVTLLLAGLMVCSATIAPAQGVPRMVSGRIFDDSTGCPLRSVQVTAVGSTTHVATDANGRYRLSDPPTGSFTLQAALSGYQLNSAPAVVVSDSLARVDFSLVRAAGDGAAKTAYPTKACRLEPRDSL
jgi:hypothetical protein